MKGYRAIAAFAIRRLVSSPGSPRVSGPIPHQCQRLQGRERRVRAVLAEAAEVVSQAGFENGMLL
jgi:hypothetical protein